MSNNYFQFRKFVVYQDRCAMKVCTDSCIAGAWFASKINDAKTVLDLGSGTGLLMLMFAQKSDARIDGIELDDSAFQQLGENIDGSIWREQLTAFHGDMRNHRFEKAYDLIITNPPFFESELQSPSKEINLARHSTALSFEELLETIAKNLKPDGRFGILLPARRAEHFESLAFKKKFYLREKLSVQQMPAHDYFRAVMLFSRQQEGEPLLTTMSIKNDAGTYGDSFTALMKEYYLNL